MGIHPVLIYVIRGQEPKFHWDGMKNEWSTYEYLNMGKFQIRDARCKKNKLFLENLIIVKPPNEAQNYVESFLIKIFTKIQMWLVN